MKINLLSKFKWYIVGFILVVIMLSVSLSFCAWDSLSLQAKMSASKSGSYKEHIKLVEDIYLTNGNKGINGIADVGDVVTFGNYYQELTDAGKVADKTAIRWIVVEKAGVQLTLIAEKVMAFGSFWGNYYYDGSDWMLAIQGNGNNYQNYSRSTVRDWLNSNYTLRNDGGTAFSSAVGTEPRFKGFLSEAFTSAEQAYITSKTILGMKGAGKDNSPAQESYDPVEDKVWLPSYIEMYGNTGIVWGVGSDNLSDMQFTHFKSNSTDRIGTTTAFASSQYSNYTYTGATHIKNAQSSSANSAAWWWLRSPIPSAHYSALVVNTSGACSSNSTRHSYGGVRPAVCVQL